MVSVRFDDLSEAYEWLDSQINYEVKLDQIVSPEQSFAIERFAERLGQLGEPQRGLRTIHIAGTRGKGSAALMLEALLLASGATVATFMSPHLHEYRERIRVNGAPVGGEAFMRGLEQVAGASAGEGAMSHAFKTVFENLTALFFVVAKRVGVDWVIVETGLGGRLDATNVIEAGPVLLTRIGLEHTHLLGKTYEAIAGEKAAILKAGGWGVMGAQRPSESGAAGATEVFRARAKAVGAPLVEAESVCPLVERNPNEEGQRLVYEFEGKAWGLEMPLLGSFVGENLQNALAMLAELRRRGLVEKAPREALSEALRGLELPGRMTVLARDPVVLADGAHCPTAAAVLAESLEEHLGECKAWLVVGMMLDKEHRAFFEALARWQGWLGVICYQAPTPRAARPEALAEVAVSFFENVICRERPEEALQSALERTEKGTCIVATGSIYGYAAIETWVRGSFDEYQNQGQAEPGSDS